MRLLSLKLLDNIVYYLKVEGLCPLVGRLIIMVTNVRVDYFARCQVAS